MRRFNFHHSIEINALPAHYIAFLIAGFAWRSRATHDAYVTPSRNYLELLPKRATQLEWVEQYKQNIIHHAAWRSNLFFLLLIAYYDKRRIIQVASTTMQYGIGVGPHIQACHSSIFPGLNDRAIDDIRINFRQTCFFKNSFLWHWNGMTVGCPVLVNEFDSFLEGRGSGSIYRKNLLFILNQCSQGICNPVEAMGFFYLVMLAAVEDQEIFLKKCEHWERKPAQRIIALQKQGMFHRMTETYLPEKAYVKAVLQWNGREKTFDDACLKTQTLLLRGSEGVGERFLKRFDF